MEAEKKILDPLQPYKSSLWSSPTKGIVGRIFICTTFTNNTVYIFNVTPMC